MNAARVAVAARVACANVAARVSHMVTALLAATLLSACGYSTGFSLPESKSVGVAVFANDSRERNVESELHGFVTDAVERFVDSRLVSPHLADFVIDGRVVDYHRRGGIRNKSNVLLETGVRIVVVGRLVRRSNTAAGAQATSEGEVGEVLRQVTVSDERGYLIADPLGESQARDSALRNIAERLVLDLFADQAYSEPR